MASVMGNKENRLLSKRNGRGNLLGVIYWMMKWAWTSQKIKWKGEHEAERWKRPCHCVGLTKDKSQEKLRDKQKGRLGLAEDPQPGLDRKAAGVPGCVVSELLPLQVSKQGCSHTTVCPTPHGRNKVTLGHRQQSLRLEALPLLLFNLLPARVIPERREGRSSPLLNDSTNLGFGFIFIPPYQIKSSKESGAWEEDGRESCRGASTPWQKEQPQGEEPPCTEQPLALLCSQRLGWFLHETPSPQREGCRVR